MAIIKKVQYYVIIMLCFCGEDEGKFCMKLRIRELREDSDLTQTQIARYLHCDQSLYSKYERGEREIPLALVIELAKYYGTSIDYIVGLSDRKESAV